MSAHTPGPWWVDARDFSGVETFTVRAGDKGSEVASGQCIQPRRKADAHLLAAAPDLLEVAKLALKVALTRPRDGGQLSEDLEELLLSARAALAKTKPG